MNKMSPVPASRRSRTSVAVLLAYLVLFAPLAPVSAQAVKVKRAPAPQSAPQPGKGKEATGGIKNVTLPNAVAAPNITATKVDAYPVHPSGQAEPGDTITYTVTISNTGPDPATGVTFTDTVDPNTTLVPGSVTTTPIANADSASAFGNVRISTANGAPNLLANDCDPDPAGGPCTNAGLTASGPTTSAQGGNVVVNSDGTFSFNPKPGFTGTDTFTYTATDGTGKTDTATVTITVGPTLIWFINNDPGAPAGNDGRITSPFSSIAAYNASSPTKDPNDIIFIYQGTYTGNLTLVSGMKLIGQGYTLQTETGAPPAGSDPLPAATVNPVINSAAGNTVTLNSNNTIRGLTLNDSAGIDLTGSSFGTLTVSNVTISGTGRPLSLTTGTLAATFDQITSTNSTGGQGILIQTNVAGTMSVTNGTSISGSTAQGILVTQSTANINFGNTSVTGGTDAIALSNNSAGTRTFGTITTLNNSAAAFSHSTGGGTTNVTGLTTITNPGTNGISVTGSTTPVTFANANITQSGAEGVLYTGSSGNLSFGDLDVAPDSTKKAISTNGNAGTLSATSGTISTTGAAALDLNSTVLSLVFDSVSAANSGTAFNAINIVGGSGSVSSAGGTITGGTNPAVLVNGGSVSLTYAGGITQSNTGALLSVLGGHTGTLTFNTGTLSATNGTGLQFADADGIYNFNGTTTMNGGDAGVDILNGSGGTFAFGGTTITNPTGVGFNVDGSTTAVTGGITISGALSKNSAGRLIDFNNYDTATATFSGNLSCTSTCDGVEVTNNGASSGTVTFSAATKTLNTGVDTAVNLDNNDGGTVNFTGGGLDIDTTSGAGFNAINGGTVNVTTGTNLNTVDTDTGTAVNISGGTNIGGSGVTFRSITVDNGASNSAVNGIILNGTTGTFLVSGDGAQTGGFFNRNGTGGTLNRTTGHSVLLTNATNVTLRQMNITNTAFGPTGAGGCPDNCVADGVHSSGGGSIVLSAVTLQNLGGNGWRANNITGTNAVNNNSLIDTWNTAATNGVTVAILSPNNYSGTFTVDRCKFTTSATGADGFLFDVDTNGGGGTVTVTNSEFTAIDQDAVQINHDGAGILNALVQANNFHDADATGGDGNNTLILALAGGGQFNFNIDNNTFTNLARLSANSGVLQVQAAGGAAGSSAGAKLNGTITNNTLTNPGFVSQRRGIMFAAEASAGNHGGHTVSIKNNSVQNFFLHGIYVSLASVAGSDCLNNNLNISNNQVGNINLVGQGGGDSGTAIEFETLIDHDSTGGDISANALIQGNTAVNNNTSGLGDTVEITNRSGDNTGAGNSSNLQLTILGNTLTQQNAGGQVFEARNSTGLTPFTTVTTCLDLNSGNTSPNNAIGGNGTGFRLTNDGGVYSIEGMGASTPSAFLGPKNQSNSASPAIITASGAFISSAGCTNSTAPAAPPEIKFPDQSAAAQTSAVVTEQVAPTFQGPINQPFITLPQQTAKPAKAEAQQVAPAAAAPQVAPVEAEQPPVSKIQGGSAKASSPSSSSPSPVVVTGAGGTVSINIGTLNSGDSVTITFQVVVDNPYSGGPNVSNQGTVSGSNFSNVLTDDPSIAGAANPTLTPILSTHIRVNDAKVSEPASGTAQMLFTVTLTAPAGPSGLTVNYATANGGATPATGGAACDNVAVDYETAAGILTFASGESVRTIPVNVCADTASPETNETFLMNISGASGGTIDDAQAVGTITQGNDPGTFLITELRTSGPGGAGAGGDDFVEFYNNTASPHTVASSDASAGYGVYKMGATCSDAPVLVATIPNGTIIPARGHYLVVGSAYSLANYGGTGAAAGNQTMTSDIETDHNVAVFTTADVNALSTSARLDAVGFASNTGGAVCDLLREGATLPSMAAAPTLEYSFFRKQETGFPQDTNANAADFRFADTGATFVSGVTQRLGAPGPENLASPIVRTSTVKSSLLDSTQPSSAAPNRVRILTPVTNGAQGTLIIRRRFTNNTGAPVTRLRFRIVDITTFPSPGGGVADVRAITSADEPGVSVSDPTTCSASGAGAAPCSVTVLGTTLETPPAQTNGGGYNSTMSAGSVALATQLAPNASINLRFVLGVQTTGNFAFIVVVEALP